MVDNATLLVFTCSKIEIIRVASTHIQFKGIRYVDDVDELKRELLITFASKYS